MTTVKRTYMLLALALAFTIGMAVVTVVAGTEPGDGVREGHHT
jgi:FtsH-binding integral membrane protein